MAIQWGNRIKMIMRPSPRKITKCRGVCPTVSAVSVYATCATRCASVLKKFEAIALRLICISVEKPLILRYASILPVNMEKS